MRKFSVASVLIAMLFMAGCTTGQVQVDQDSQVVIAKIAGRHAGNELMKKYPDIAIEVAKVCNKVVVEDNSDIIVTLGKSMIAVLTDSQIEDSLLKTDIADITEMIEVKSGITVTEEQLAVIQAIATGLISGIEIAQQQD